MIVAIIDYGLGNVGSVKNMLTKIGVNAIITNNHNEISQSDFLILPGVGSFDKGMKNLKEYDLISVLNNSVLVDKKPILGICLGMQLMAKNSEEGKLEGLGWIDADVKKFNFPKSQNMKVPHMGWNTIDFNKESRLANNLTLEKRFYFVHSYYVCCNNENDILSKSPYGFEFHSSFEKENIIGVQFHPEKSHRFGMQILKNFTQNQKC